MLSTPILLIIFNRPDTTKKVFEQIRKIKPKKLFVAADAPRNATDQNLCEQARQLATKIDWDCELKTLFQETNLGCGQAPAAAISWFFEQEEEGIILEDDCLPDLSFFGFCKEMLQRFRQDENIFMVSGTNYAQSWYTQNQSYHFSFYGSCWGWATWRRAWQHFDYQLKEWENPQNVQLVRNIVANDRYYGLYLEPVYQKTFQNPQTVSWWDYQWSFARYLKAGLAVVPSQNLIKNIGFGQDATHTNAASPDPFVNLPTSSIAFPLLDNTNIVPDRLYEKFIYDTLCPPPLPLWERIIRKVTKIVGI